MCEVIATLRCSCKCCATIGVRGSYFAYSCQPKLESTVGGAGKNPGHARNEVEIQPCFASRRNSVAKSLSELWDLALSLYWWERILEFPFKPLAKMSLSWSVHTVSLTPGGGWWAMWLQLHADGGCKSQRDSHPALSVQRNCIRSESQGARVGKWMGLDFEYSNPFVESFPSEGTVCFRYCFVCWLAFLSWWKCIIFSVAK